MCKDTCELPGYQCYPCKAGETGLRCDGKHCHDNMTVIIFATNPARCLSFVNLKGLKVERLRTTKRFIVRLTQQNEINGRNQVYQTVKFQAKPKQGSYVVKFIKIRQIVY